MKSDSSVTVNYANLTFSFRQFQEQYKNLCQNISTNKIGKTLDSVKMVSSLYSEYKCYVSSKELRTYFDNYIYKLKKEIVEDTEFIKICNQNHKSTDEIVFMYQRYYYYLVKILKVVGAFGDELSKTFMPNKTDRKKLLKFWNNNAFFEQFTYYKSDIASNISNFNIRNFKDTLSSFMCFYFAYYLFIDEQSRFYCEKLFSNVLTILLDREVLSSINTDFKFISSSKKVMLKELDFKVHDAINMIFYQCNKSYSNYGIIPRIDEPVLIDRTAI